MAQPNSPAQIAVAEAWLARASSKIAEREEFISHLLGMYQKHLNLAQDALESDKQDQYAAKVNLAKLTKTSVGAIEIRDAIKSGRTSTHSQPSKLFWASP